MAAIVQSEPFSIFFRKIGYSVGLENTLSRIGDLESRYLADRDLTSTTWKDIRQNKWGLSTDNISDVFESLGYIGKSNGDVLVCDNLDATVLAAELGVDAGGDELLCRKFVLLNSILMNDGEIFLNMLAAGFEENAIRNRLVALINYKRESLYALFPASSQRVRISRVVNIERQVTNRGSKGSEDGRDGLRRTTPLSASRRMKPLDDKPQPEISVSNPDELFSSDYFRKVPARRKEWARSLDLWDDEQGLTARGRNFLSKMSDAGYTFAPSAFVLWPLDYELVRSGIAVGPFPRTPSLWGFLVDVASSYCNVGVKAVGARDSDKMAELFTSMMKLYRGLHVRKSMLRRELPLTVAFPASVAIAAAQGHDVLNLQELIRREQASKSPKVAMRRSRRTGGAITV